MNNKGHNNSLYFKILFVVSLAILLLIAALTFKHFETINKSTEEVMHTQLVNLKLEQLASTIKDAETGISGYLLSEDPKFLEPFYGSKTKALLIHDELKKLTNNNNIQKENLEEYLRLINLRFALWDKIESQNSNPNYKNSQNFIADLNRGRSIMDSINAETSQMLFVEKEKLKIRNSDYQYQTKITPVFTIGMVFFVLFLLIFSFLKINNDVRKLQLSNDEFMFSKTSSDQAEILGNYSSWLWNLDTHKMTFSNNQYRLLGCEPQSFEASNEKFLEYVHPEDKNILEKIILQVIEEQHLKTVYFRIVRKDGEIRYLKSSGKLLLDSYNNRNIIGNTSDITEERLANLAIEARNLELEQSNNELASFNHVASHDLQEPLRKIQTFISRFSEVDKANLSETGKTYFIKIEEALTRMRSLIDDLLMFSRTNKSEKVFEKFDLNTTFENATQELSQVISDKKAVIESTVLPKLNIIPFQMQQLFVNLIGNSLKYSNPNTTPTISIQSEKILATDYPILIKPVSKHYYKISFTDNGLGFEQEYAEKIFLLFNRLHHSKAYKGTGIGLTICKKIAENHYGYISAEGRLNEGATFNLFLPF